MSARFLLAGAVGLAALHQLAVAAAVAAEPITDSEQAFAGVQCLNGWRYGYYDITLNGLPDAGGGDFLPFPNDGDQDTADNYWKGTLWGFPTGSNNPPWTVIASPWMHPSGTNNGEEHWATRRYTVQPTAAGDLVADWSLSALNALGTGTSVHVLHNGAEMDKATIAGDDTVGVQLTTGIPRTRAGDRIDFSLTPEGPGNDRSDGSDASNVIAQLTRDDATGFAVDRVDDEPTATACTAAPNDCSLRGAVTAANASPGSSTVLLPAGRFRLTNADEGALGATEPLVVVGAGPWRTVIDATGLGDRIFEASDGLFLRGLALTGGSGGAGAASVNGDFELSDCDVYGNLGEGGAGGAFNLQGGKAIIAGSTVRDNAAQVAGGLIANGTELQIWNSTFSGNEASEAGGGVLVYGGSLHLTHATFTRNQAPLGDAITLSNGATGTAINSLVEGSCGFYFSSPPGISSLGGNVGQPGVDCGFDHASDAIVPAGGTDLTELLLGGPRPPAHSPLASSAAIDSGVIGAELCAATDQLGASRYANGDSNDGPRFDAGAVERAQFRVTTTADLFDAGSTNCEETCSLRTAVYAANQRPGLDLIELPPGIYSLSLVGSGEDAATTGDLDITDDLEIRGSAPGDTIIDGDLADRVFHVAASVEVHLTQLAIRNGLSSEPGGGIRQESSSRVHLTRVVVSDNFALAGGGGGIFTEGHLEVDASTISANTATGVGAAGGGVHGSSSSVVEIVNSTIDGNTADTGASVYNGGQLSVTNATLTGGSGTLGTALRHGSNSSFVGLDLLIEGTCLNSGTATLVSRGGNLESPGDSCDFDHASDQTGLADLMLEPLGDHGGPTPTRPPLPGSPAIDAGVSLGCLPFAQTGLPRPTDGDGDASAECDSGAYEAVPEPSWLCQLATGVALLACARRRFGPSLHAGG